MDQVSVAPTLRTGGLAPDSRLIDGAGDSVHLSSFWSTAPNGAVVIFLRHFGCLFCREHAVRLRDAYPSIASREINLVAIGLGSPADAAGFASWLKLPYPVLGSADTHIHAQWGLGKVSKSDMINPALIKAGVRAVTQGARPGKPTGDAHQLPGAFIVDHDGILRWTRPSTHPGDNVPITELLAAIDAIRVAVAV